MQSYDEVYAGDGFYWGTEPNRLCRQVVDILRDLGGVKKRVVDLGSGEGKDAMEFARHGHEVLGIDISLQGVSKAKRWAREMALDARFVQGDILSYRLSEGVDVVYSSGTLTYLPMNLRAEFFQNLKYFTAIGGINALNVFVEKPYIVTAPDWGTEEFYYRSGELLGYYWDWEILFFEEVEFDCQSSGVAHRHAMDTLIAHRRM